MKKLILTTITVVALATALSANVLEEKKDYTCKLFSNENFAEIVKNDDVKDFIKSKQSKDNTYIVAKISSKAKGTEEALNSTRGTLSAEFLKEKGIGIKTNLSYKNLYWNYNVFLAKLVEANAEIDVVAFFINRYSEIKKDKKMNEFLSQKISMIDFLRQNKELDFNMFINFVMNNKDKKMNKFFKYISLKDYSRAYNFIADENDKSNFINVLKNLRSACMSKETKNIKDILSFDNN